MLKPTVEVRNEGGVLVAEFWDCLRLDPNPVRDLRQHYEAHVRSKGKPDLVISHLNEPVTILRNVAATEGRHWVGIELVGQDHRDVVGGRVKLETPAGTLTRFVKGGGSFASTNDRRLLFGLGSETTVGKLTVYWPWGESQVFIDLTADRYWKLVEGRSAPK